MDAFEFQQTPQLQTVPVQIPIGQINGQLVFQTVQVSTGAIQPALQASGAGN